MSGPAGPPAKDSHVGAPVEPEEEVTSQPMGKWNDYYCFKFLNFRAVFYALIENSDVSH